jgi:RHS repeat-associated protein
METEWAFVSNNVRRHSNLSHSFGDRRTFAHQAAGRRTLTELANGARTSYTYDAASRIQQLCNLKADGSVILGLTYEHDPVGNPTSMLESSGDLVTWTYDATDRLTREQRSGPSAYDTTYSYDPLGNRLVKDASGAMTTSTYDLANQLVTSQDANGATTYTHDLAGNLHIVEQPTGQRTTTTWDDQNRQTAVLQPTGAITTNTFRFAGLRYSKQEPQSTSKFLWDVNNYLAETDTDDDIQAVYTNEPQPYGNLISQYRKGPTLWLPSYYHYDALGSTRVLTNDAGVVTDTHVYDAWGNELAVSGSTVNPFRWVGRVGYYWDEGTGTFYIRARVYQPVTGRWTSQDPLWALAHPVLDVRLYEYASDRPLVRSDPSGLRDLDVPGTPSTGGHVVLIACRPLMSCQETVDQLLKEDLKILPRTPKPECANLIQQCNPRIRCAAQCGGPKDNPWEGQTWEDGERVNVCIREDLEDPRLILAHELVHVCQHILASKSRGGYGLCKSSPATGPLPHPPVPKPPENPYNACTLCLARETEAYEHSCKLAYPLLEDRDQREQCVRDGLKFSCGHISGCEKRIKYPKGD